jgi:dGTPase
VVNICDEIAYNNHDLDDGIESGYLSKEELSSLEIWSKAYEQAQRNFPIENKKILVRYAIRWMINYMVTDLIEQIKINLENFKIKNLDDVLGHNEEQFGKIVTFSKEVSREVRLLKRFLFLRLYRHADVVTMNVRASEVVKRMFSFFSENIGTMPEEFHLKIHESKESRFRVVADFIAGMTDRYAFSWNKKILGLD